MPTDADLCSAALVKLGAAPIASLDDDTTEAVIAKRLYPIARDALLSCHPWHFTLTQTALALAEETRESDFINSFHLPDDLLRVLSAGGGARGRGLTYRIVGQRLNANAAEVTLTYQRRPDASEFPPYFTAALTARLAAELALPITEIASRADVLQKLATAELRLAKLVDSQQSSPQAIDDFTLVNVRY